MKVCIPTMGDRGMEETVGGHFGRVPTYTLVDTDSVIPEESIKSVCAIEGVKKVRVV